MNNPPEELNKLVEIPEADVKGRHVYAHCSRYRCRNPIKYKMVIEEGFGDELYYNTAYWCEEHKPKE